MDALFKGRQLTTLLDCRMSSVEHQIFVIKKKLSEINFFLEENKTKYNSINQDIQSLTSCGVFQRTKIYKNIRRQGVLLSQQLHIFDEIRRLEDDKVESEKLLKEGVNIKNDLEKKRYKFLGYFRKQHMEFLARCENNTEYELHETFIYGRAKL